MKTRRLFAGVALTGSLVWAVPLPAAPAPDASAALASRFESLALNAGLGQKPTPGLLRERAFLAQAAARLDGTQSRYSRLEAQLFLEAKDTPDSIEALRTYLGTTPADQFAQAQMIDLFVSQMQTADSIISYLHGVIGKTSLPAPVRAHAAVLCAQTYLSRSQPEEALKVVNAAIAIDPLDSEALRLKMSLSQKEGPAQRLGILLAILRANPNDGEAATEVAGALADCGLVEDSLTWYNVAFNLSSRTPAFARGAAVESALAGRPGIAINLLDTYLKAAPDDADAWMIRLALAKASDKPEDLSKTTADAIAALTANFQSIRATLGPIGAGSQTEPSTQAAALPDLSGDTTLLVQKNDPQLTDAYVSAAQNLAWIRLYFLRDASGDTQTLITALQKMLPEDDMVLARLIGWQYLARAQADEARQKLQGVAAADPYAALGLMQLDPATSDQHAPPLMAAHPSGTAAVVIYEALKSHGAKVLPIGQADAVKAECDAFPKDLLNITIQPQGFYQVTAEPVESEASFGDPLLARITLQNTSKYDLAIGPEGAIHPSLVFGVNVQGLVEKSLPKLAHDTYWQRLVLPAKGSASQVVRLDRGALAQLLSAAPDVPLELAFNITTNPANAKEDIVPGLGGIQTHFASLLERLGFPLRTDADRDKLFDRMAHGSAKERLDATETCAAISAQVASLTDPASLDKRQALIKQNADHLQQATTDADPFVATWAMFLRAKSLSGNDQTALIHQLSTDPLWPRRAIALLLAQSSADGGGAVASALANDSDSTVKFLAATVADSSQRTDH